MKIPFLKMHGLGNDFVVIDNRHSQYTLNIDNIKLITDRHWGVGCDQLLILEKSSTFDFLMRVYNNDGSEAGGCGNGARCITKYLYELEGKKNFKFETINTVWQTQVLEDDLFQVNMGHARLDWQEIPLKQNADTLNLNLDAPFPEIKNIPAVCVNMGNPHAVFFLPHVEKIDISKIGSWVENHPMFPKRTNVEFAEVLDKSHIRMRVWERGAGITQACGTGACATLVAAVRLNLIEKEADIILDGGTLHVLWQKNADGSDEVIMSGPATKVFASEFSI